MKNLILLSLLLVCLPIYLFFELDAPQVSLVIQEEVYMYMLLIFFSMALFFSFFVLPYTVSVWRSFKTKIMMNYTFVYFCYIFMFGIFMQLVCALAVIQPLPGLMKDNVSMLALQCISWLAVSLSVILTRPYNFRRINVLNKKTDTRQQYMLDNAESFNFCYKK
ncbi:MAG: hypothetical protein RL687_350 [Candidatus Parcubacteria bacterium]|jgi:hypothetical protein